MEDLQIMVVDDEKVILESINDYLSDYRIHTFSDSREACRNLNENRYDIIVSDYKMPGMNGLELFSAAKSGNAYIYGILLTAYADKGLLEEFIDRDVIKRVLEKPLRLDLLKEAIDRGIEECRLITAERTRIGNMKLLCQDAFKGLDFLNDAIIGIDGGLREVFQMLKDIAPTSENVLITGETGTGKEVVARAIHLSSERKDGPFVKINCGAIPDSLIESELFGYVRGAFSGAQGEKPGKIELASGGTLFLDEIGELNPDMQTRLLHVVQEKRVERLGSNKSIAVDFRLVSATNRKLDEEILKKSFREDLYYRVGTFPIHMPALRERKEDLKPLIEYLVRKYAKEIGRPNVSVDDTVFETLKDYSWPGNVRELENVVKRSILLMDKNSNEITGADFFYLFSSRDSVDLSYDRAIDIIKNIILANKGDLKSVEKDVIGKILTHFNGNVMEAVNRSGIPKDRFYRNR